MRIRKGHRCLPLPPADRSLASDKIINGANGALLSLVALAAADNLIGSPQQQHATSMVREKSVEHELEKKRVSADDDFNCRSSFCNAGVDSTVRESAETPQGAKSVYTRHSTLDTTGTISSSMSAIEIQHQADLLAQSLCHLCSRAGMTGLSVRDAVAQIMQQRLPGLNGVGEGLIEQVKKSFQHSSIFVECKERGTYYLRDLPAGKKNKLLVTGDSEFHREKTVSSSDMLGAAEQLQYLQKSCSNSLGSGVVEPSETPSVHGGKRKAVQKKGNIRQSKVARIHKDVTVTSHNSSSSASRSQNVNPTVSQCVREDGKRWRCSQPAEAGFAMCSYHRDLVNQGKARQKKTRLEEGPNPTFRYVANGRVMKNAIVTETTWSPFFDDELSYDEHRQFVKAKSITSLLLNSDVRPRR